MKKKYNFKIITFFALLLIILCSTFNGYAFADIESGKVTFQYPINPDMEEWALYTRVELGEMLQIPDDILSKLSTEDLANIVMDYPYLIDIYFFNTYQQGFDTIKSSFNGLQELLNRNDAGIYLLNLFKKKIRFQFYLKI